MALEAREQSGATVPGKGLLHFDSHKGPPTGHPPLATRRVTRVSNNSNPHRGVIPKRGYVTQRSGASPEAKIKFCRVFGDGT
jgi:hypothetical protein